MKTHNKLSKKIDCALENYELIPLHHKAELKEYILNRRAPKCDLILLLLQGDINSSRSLAMKENLNFYSYLSFLNAYVPASAFGSKNNFNSYLKGRV
jgi:hypothetical protein